MSQNPICLDLCAFGWNILAPKVYDIRGATCISDAISISKTTRWHICSKVYWFKRAFVICYISFSSICFVLNSSQHHLLSRFCFTNVNISNHKHVFKWEFFVTIILLQMYLFQLVCFTVIFVKHIVAFIVAIIFPHSTKERIIFRKKSNKIFSNFHK